MKFGKYQIARTKTGRCRWRNDHTTIYEGIKTIVYPNTTRAQITQYHLMFLRLRELSLDNVMFLGFSSRCFTIETSGMMLYGSYRRL